MLVRKSKTLTKRKKPTRPAQKTAEQLMREQGKTESCKFQNIVGIGRDLWKSDEEFDEFVRGIYERRKKTRVP